MPALPTRSKHTVLKQMCELIPPGLVAKLAREQGVAARAFCCWSHVVAMLYAHLTHALGLNDVCDSLRNHGGALAAIRGARAPSRNGLSHANKTRKATMAEDLFWRVLRHLESTVPGFGGRTYQGFPRRFKRAIHIVDSTTISLIAHCMDWASHRRRKAAAKLHLRLNLQSFLPRFAIVATAREGDVSRSREVCAGLKRGEVAIFDRGYIHFGHLNELTQRGVIWVTRAKDNMKVRCVKRIQNKRCGNILRDDVVELSDYMTGKKYETPFRRIVALVELKGEWVEMVFITNEFTWAPGTVADLYKRRWSIEAFFKQIKQVLQLCDFLGHSQNAIQWQVWTALLAFVLLRFLAFISNWHHSFIRIFTTVRAVLWSRFDLLLLLRSYGTAGGCFRMLSAPEQAYLPGMKPIYGTAHGLQ
jgi:hypothetical protein